MHKERKCILGTHQCIYAYMRIVCSCCNEVNARGIIGISGSQPFTNSISEYKLRLLSACATISMKIVNT